ncbi:MAG TPA: WG repeat-containing protein [Symbiobacteriaceae bacterium]|nr:WG repeat-containing protein [Symbiobacteriaceae bacterium]
MKRSCAWVIWAALLLIMSGCAKTAGETPPVGAPKAQPVPAVASTPAREESPVLYPAYVFELGRPKWGYIDRTGRFVIQPAFEAAEEFAADGTAVVYRDGRAGLIGRDGKFLVQPQYDYAYLPSPAGERVLIGQGKGVAVGPGGKVLFASPELDGPFRDGLARIKRGNVSGYINTAGAVVIEPQFQYAHDFAAGKAVVQIREGQFALIDKAGERLGEYAYEQLRGPSEDLLVYMVKGPKYGYLTLAGEVALAAQFGDAHPFEDGLAIVGAGDWSDNRYGVINRKGEYVIPAEHGLIRRMGPGLFSVSERRDPPFSLNTRQALFSADGKQLTAFRYYDMEPAGDGLVSATDETATLLLDKTGSQVPGLPRLTGIGQMRLQGDLVRADIDQTLSYLTRDRKLIWQADRNVALAGGLTVQAQRHRPNRNTLIYYPELTGLADQKIQQQINTRLRAIFGVADGGAKRIPGESSLTEVFGAQRLGNLLIINRDGYEYTAGAAHGMPILEYYHLDLTTGAEYALPDLFKPGSAYTDRLKAFVHHRIAKSGEFYLNRSPEVKPDQKFTVQEGALVIYYYPYEIASYAQGFQRFSVPWAEIQDLINTEGAFWKAFH